MVISRIDKANRKIINDFIISNWYTSEMVVRGKVFDLTAADGAAAFEHGDIIGLITYIINDDTMEILSLDSLHENMGIGTELLNEAIKAAKENGCKKITVITTNDNINAIRFYQKRRFDLCRIYHGAVNKARLIKPEIPLISENGIPIEHELEFELRL